MGCDIHAFVEYAPKLDAEEPKPEKRFWRPLGGDMYIGRDYYLFATMCNGVRIDDLPHTFEPKGIAEDMAFYADMKHRLYIASSDESVDEYSATREQAENWVKLGYSQVLAEREGVVTSITNPDWHSYSWLTTEEVKQIPRMYKKNLKASEEDPFYFNVGINFKAIIEVMKLYEKNEYDARLVFWFDN